MAVRRDRHEPQDAVELPGRPPRVACGLLVDCFAALLQAGVARLAVLREALTLTEALHAEREAWSRRRA
jgi:hypothetical protein